MMKNVAVRAPEKFIKDAKRIATLEYVDKSTILREALERGLSEIKLETAIKRFREGKASTSEAAEIAEISLGEMMDELMERGIRQDIGKEELEGNLEKALKMVK